MIGKRFGRLLVIEEFGVDSRGEFQWVCRCDCGNVTHPIKGSVLRTGKSQSCGCLEKELKSARSSTHRKSQTRLYNIWSCMKGRCFSKGHPAFSSYGGRGIAVCDEWKNNFQAFYDWAMSNGYSDELTIDRIDVNGDYCPENCRWISISEQQHNKRCNVVIAFNGESHTLKQWSEITGINYKTLHQRYSKGKRDTKLFGESLDINELASVQAVTE